MPIGPLPSLPKFRTDLVTRRLCATAHLDPWFTREVLAEYAEDGLQAVGLPVGVNVIALVRHARLSESRLLRRDRALAALLALLLALLATVVLSLSAGRTPVATGALAGVLAVFAAALVVVHRALWSAWQLALELGDGQQSALALAPPVDPALEQRLASLKRVNLVVYHESVAAQNPFVGSGWRISETVWTPINVGRPAKDAAGNPQTPIPFTAADLHGQVARRIAKASGLDGLSVRNRLYVKGHFVSQLPGALPDPTQRPLSVIDSDWVKAGAAQPTSGLETYLCLRAIGEGGKVVVSMHARAQLNHPLLTWEINAYVLPPLGTRFLRPNRLVAGPLRLRFRAAEDALRTTPGLLFGSARALLRRSLDTASGARALEKTRREIRKGYASYDYGTTNSLRERAASWTQMGFAERRDAATYFKLMVQAVLSSTQEFLEAHRIDTFDLDAQQQQIITTQTTIFNGNISQSVIGGANNVQNNQGPVAPPGGGSSSGQQSGAAAPAATP
ncbi:hypothetical protein [Kitasatospora azatica]|uniref:hypothetical protein n=1 Tax=Kitasatospora azatica TaxID=58347 RepID=UPI0005657B2C|nr:hypothetical protein [Kitasatospora azatica]